MSTIMIAQDYEGQHALLEAQLRSAGIGFNVCNNTEIDLSISTIRFKPDIIILNASRLGFQAVKAIYDEAVRETQPVEFVNLYTYEDQQELKMLIELGIEHNYPIPYDPVKIVSFLEGLRNSAPINLEDFIQRISDRIDSFMSSLNPSKRQRGNIYIREAVLILLFENRFKASFHSNIFPRIAAKYSTTPRSVEHSIRIAINSCWESQSKSRIIELMGSPVSDCKRPSSCTFISALAQHFIRDNGKYFDLFQVQITNSTCKQLHI